MTSSCATTKNDVGRQSPTFDEVHGEHAAVVRLPAGLVFCLVATPGTPLGGFALLCGDPGSMGWAEALDVFLSQTPFERSAVTWVPGDEPDGA